MKIRKARIEDSEALLRIYGPYVKETAISFEYEVPSQEEFEERIRTFGEKYPYLVAEDEKGNIMGYAYAHAFHPRPGYRFCVETTVYIDRSQRRSGVGRRLYEALEDALRKQGIKNMYACIAYAEQEDEYLTHDSICFHEKMGFKEVAHLHRCGQKFDRWFDIMWMEKLL